MPAHLKDLTGQSFGRLLVLSRFSRTPNGISTWTCYCSCGKTKNIRADVLRKGTSQSCGCLARELSSLRNAVHGCSYNRTTEYNIWNGMKQRCCNSNGRDYPRYGGRGIKVCDRWKDSFENFYLDMGPRPSTAMSLDRINNDGNYEPGNCRWATASEQQHNRRDNVPRTAKADFFASI